MGSFKKGPEERSCLFSREFNSMRPHGEKRPSREQSPQDPYSPPPPQGAQTHLGIEVQVHGFYCGVRVQEPGH